MSCIFCKIVSGDIPSSIVYEDDKILAFHDIDPKAPIHVVIIPKCHIDSICDIDQINSDVIAHIFSVIPKMNLNLSKGYRVVSNCKEDGGQTVNHLHFHLLAGRNLGWPPG